MLGVATLTVVFMWCQSGHTVNSSVVEVYMPDCVSCLIWHMSDNTQFVRVPTRSLKIVKSFGILLVLLFKAC